MLALIGLEVRRIPPEDTAMYLRLYGKESTQERRFYNVGAGSFSHPCWTNLDYISDWYAGVQKSIVHYDLMADSPLPIPPGTAEIIYTSHTVEHVSDEAVERLFRNAFAALKPGGIFRVTTGPDADSDFRAMMAGDTDWFYWDVAASSSFDAYRHVYHAPPNTRPIEERWLHHIAGQLLPNNRAPSDRKFTGPEIRKIVEEKGFPGALDYFTALCTFQPEFIGNHISWWNGDKLIDRLKAAGFTKVYRSGYGQSASPVLRNTRYFDNTHPQMSVYVEAVR